MAQSQDFVASSPFSAAASPRLPILAALNRAALAGIGGLLDWQRRARERQHLAYLSEADLKDVGLSRADILRETDKPFWRA